MTRLKTWWYRPPGFTNFGDELGHIFLNLLGFDIEYVDFGQAEILTTGSILQRHNREPLRDGAILWGTGWHKDPVYNLPELDVRAVRGTLTADQVGVVDVPLGDPGILASHFWPAAGKKHKLGFVRHYIDQVTTIPGAVLIDPTWEPETVCRAISECEAIVSSSLHGCIVAHSYGIPFMRIPHGGVVGGDTKWVDFTTSLNFSVEALQQGLIESIKP